MQVHNVYPTNFFDSCCKKCVVSQEVIDKFITFLYGFNFSITQRSERPYMTPRGTAQLWEIRVANPQKGRGASGGYRTLVYYLKTEETFYLDFIEERPKLGKKHVQKNYNDRLIELKKHLKENYE